MLIRAHPGGLGIAPRPGHSRVSGRGRHRRDASRQSTQGVSNRSRLSRTPERTTAGLGPAPAARRLATWAMLRPSSHEDGRRGGRRDDPRGVLYVVHRTGERRLAMRPSNETTLMATVALARRVSPEPLTPIEVRVSHAAPPSTAAHEDWFGFPPPLRDGSRRRPSVARDPGAAQHSRGPGHLAPPRLPSRRGTLRDLAGGPARRAHEGRHCAGAERRRAPDGGWPARRLTAGKGSTAARGQAG